MNMFEIRNNYLPTAKENEVIFRNILRDLKVNRSRRPGGCYIPKDLDTEASLEVIFEKYSAGSRYGIFTITDFEVSGTTAHISFQNVAPLSGGGAELMYLRVGNCVKYFKSDGVFMS